MAHLENSTFHRRHNENGEIDSICLHCFMTIGSDRDEQQLLLQECAHRCDPINLHLAASSFGHLGTSPSQ